MTFPTDILILTLSNSTLSVVTWLSRMHVISAIELEVCVVQVDSTISPVKVTVPLVSAFRKAVAEFGLLLGEIIL
ncbi:hypothetical protein SAMN02744778_03253 [Pantoea sp. GL120224-02]|jgi:hypothetical protein|nr:hypothetical protein SAMN02744778_03253 [Pantoea sp. GL120224-02]